jgi:SOS-response transcriptional repressor LexA
MTKKRTLVLEFIKVYTRMHGVSPSYEVIAKSLGLNSKSNIHRIVHRLKDDGFLTVKAYKFHSVKLVDQSVKAITSL